MRSRLLWVIIIGIAFVMQAVTAGADVPTLINYQGVLLDSEGHPVTGPANVAFTIYDLPSGGTVIWQETQLVEFDENGRFDVSLGEITPVTDEVFSDPIRWLGMQVEGDDELEPRTRIVSVAYAHRIGTVDGAAGGIISGDVAIQSDLDVNGDIRVTGKATIGPGHTNTGNCAFVAGEDNTASVDYATVGGGRENTSSGLYNVVSGGRYNSAIVGIESVIGGGNNNTAIGSESVIGGGSENVAGGEIATIGGGSANFAGSYATVGGGANNSAAGEWSTVAGGVEDSATASRSMVGGGVGNTAGGEYSFVGGGYDNKTAAPASVVAGGQADTASGAWSAIGGGQENAAKGFYACVPGGQGNTASGDHSFAAGRQARAIHNGTFVWGDQTDAPFISSGEDQFLIRASGGVGIGTPSPDYKLDVEGTVGIDVGSNYSDVPLTIDVPVNQAGLISRIAKGGSIINVVDNNGNVGIGTFSPQGALDVNSTTGAFIVPRMTTAERDALTAVNGMIVYNATTDQFNFYENGAWVTK